MSRMFVSGNRAADFLIYLINNGKDKGIYVSYDKPIKITDLANKMIKESGKDIEIDFIGMKPGEKLSEKSFRMNEVITTDILGLGIIKHYNYNLSYIESAISKLNRKKELKSNKDIQNSFEKLYND